MVSTKWYHLSHRPRNNSYCTQSFPAASSFVLWSNYPHRSYDIPLDFFSLWDYMKQKVYAVCKKWFSKDSRDEIRRIIYELSQDLCQKVMKKLSNPFDNFFITRRPCDHVANIIFRIQCLNFILKKNINNQCFL